MSKFFINRPIVAMVISIVTVIAGLVAMRTLPLAQFPEEEPGALRERLIAFVRDNHPKSLPRTRQEPILIAPERDASTGA